MDLAALATALVLAFVSEKLVEAIITPIWVKFGLDRFYLLYVGLVVGTGLGLCTGLDAFPFFDVPLVGQALTSLVIGCGSTFLWDLVDKVPSLP